MAITVEHVVAGLVVFIFGSSGILKLFPIIPSVHQHLITSFVHFAPVCPTTYFGYTPNPDTYRLFIGVIEVMCVIGLFIGSMKLRHWIYGLFIIIMIGATYTLAMIRDFGGIGVPISTLIACLYMFKRTVQTQELQFYYWYRIPDKLKELDKNSINKK